MCERCDTKVVAKKWTMWFGIIVTLLLFVLSQVFMYGKVVGVLEAHIDNDPTYRELTEKFVEQGEFDTIKEMIFYLYKKEGGK